MAIAKLPRFVGLPGASPAKIDANIVACVRLERSDHGTAIVVHTTEGFAFPLFPETDKSAVDFYHEILAIIWPPKTRSTTK